MDRIIFWREVDYDSTLANIFNWALTPFCLILQKVLDTIRPQITHVKIDRWDTWSMDHTLAHIIITMLKQLKETKHGAPCTDDEDVPEYLRSHMAQPKEN